VRQPPELVAELLRDRPFFDASGGGVTFSGGEPLMQADFLFACLEACRREGLHAAVDTCGLAPLEVVREAARLADLILFDIKHMDPDRHLRLTGRDNRQILDNLRDLSGGAAEIWIRVPVIPDVNDGSDNLEALATFLASLARKHPVFLLPYHAMARGKSRRLGGESHAEPYATPEPSTLAAARTRLMAAGLEATTVGGTP
jgi:pyruvate formate lyase activating enzyme